MAKKVKSVGISVSEQEYELWKETAVKKDLSLAAFVRQAVNVYIKMLEKIEEKAKK